MATKLVACLDCGQEVSPRASECPKCGRTMRKSRRGCLSTLGWGVALGILGLIVLAFIAPSGPRDRASSPPATSTTPSSVTGQPLPVASIHVGDEVLVEVPGANRIFLAAAGDDSAWRALLDAENARNLSAVAGLVARGRAISEANGARATVLELGIESATVRIVAGEHPGAEGVIQREVVRPASPR